MNRVFIVLSFVCGSDGVEYGIDFWFVFDDF